MLFEKVECLDWYWRKIAWVINAVGRRWLLHAGLSERILCGSHKTIIRRQTCSSAGHVMEATCPIPWNYVPFTLTTEGSVLTWNPWFLVLAFSRKHLFSMLAYEIVSFNWRVDCYLCGGRSLIQESFRLALQTVASSSQFPSSPSTSESSKLSVNPREWSCVFTSFHSFVHCLFWKLFFSV